MYATSVLFSTETEDSVTDTDPVWASVEEDSAATSKDGKDDEKESNVKIGSNTPPENEPKFLIFYTMLPTLFSMFCFRCKMGKPEVEMKQHGTMVTVI